MEEKINLLYNFLYNENYKTCFDIDKIQLGKITIEDIKITNQEESLALLKEIIGSKLSYTSSTDQLIYLKRFSDSFPVTIKIGFYTDEPDNLSNKANNDALFSYLLSQLVINKKTQHILLPIVNFDISFEKIEPLLKNLPIYKMVKEKIDYSEIKNTLSVRVREHFLQSKILKEYMEKNSCDYKPLIFQVIHTLAVLQKEFPGFRHNNLTPENILVYINKKPEDMLYEFGNKRWKLENINFYIKIGNFEKSTLPKHYGVKNQRDTDVPYITQINDYFDIHIFLNALINKNGLLNLSNCELETKNFIDKVLPVKLRGKSTNETLFKPSDLLKDVYFSKFSYKESVIQSSDDKVESSEEKPVLESVRQNSDDKVESSESSESNEEKTVLESVTQSSYDNTTETKVESSEEKPVLDSDKSVSYTNLKLGKMKMNKDYKNIFGAQESLQQNNTDTKIPPWDPRHPNYNPNHKNERSKPWEPKESNSNESSDEIKQEVKESVRPNHEKLKPWDPKHPNYNPDLNKKVERKEIKPVQTQEKKELKPVQEIKKKETYFKEVKPWDKKEDTLPVREPFKPREDLNPERPMPIRPNENFQENKVLDTMDYQTPPTFIPLYDPTTNAINKLLPYVPTYTPNVPVNKIYNISLSNPQANHGTLSMIYEDILPGEKTIYTFLTLKERTAIKSSLRTSVLNKYDGEELTIADGKNSILSWLKIYDLNPYNNNPNPYVNIPYGFSIYRSAYPIKYSREENTLKSTPTSIAVNIRIYQLSAGAIVVQDYESGNYKYFFDIWRELDYYKKIESIIKNKQSPNFLNLLLYFFDSTTNIDFDSLMVKNEGKVNNQKINNELVKKVLTIPNEKIPGTKFVDSTAITYNISTRPVRRNVNLTGGGAETILASSNQETNLDLTKTDNKKLIILTEGANVNILKWKSKIYEPTGSVLKNISTGYHTTEVWRSILFQMVYACAILEKHEMYFNNFSLKNNFFIKEVQTETTSQLCWLYKINNIEYYIPNYGYVLAIDSNYSDITEIKDTIQFKINGKTYDNNAYDPKYIKESLKSFMNADNWNLEASNVIINTELSDEVKNLMKKISEKLQDKTIIESLPECFPEFFNNKFGKLITRAEKENFSVLNKPIYKSGSLMIRQKRYDEYDWVIYMGDKDNKKVIKTIEGTKEVFGASLFSYPENITPDDVTIIDTFIY